MASAAAASVREIRVIRAVFGIFFMAESVISKRHARRTDENGHRMRKYLSFFLLGCLQDKGHHRKMATMVAYAGIFCHGKVRGI
jgi:hypothetical protein